MKPQELFPKCPTEIIDAVAEYAPRYGIKNMKMFWAQAAHESAEFTVFSENLNYSVDGLIKMFGRHRISIEDAANGRRWVWP